MVEKITMKCDEQEIDSLDVFSQHNSDDVYLDSLELTTNKDISENVVRFNYYILLLFFLLLFFFIKN